MSAVSTLALLRGPALPSLGLPRSGPSAAPERAWAQGRTLLPCFEKIGHALADHNRRGIGVGANAIRHDRGVRNAQILQPVHPSVLVHDRHGVRGWPHLAGATDVMGGPDVTHQ